MVNDGTMSLFRDTEESKETVVLWEDIRGVPDYIKNPAPPTINIPDEWNVFAWTAEEWRLYDTNQSNVLALQWNEDDTSDRTFKLQVNAGDVVLDMQDGTNIFSSDVTVEGDTVPLVAKSSDTTAVLEVQPSDGYRWQMGEINNLFVLRDRTAGNSFLRAEQGALGDTIYIDNQGFVGLSTSNPERQLHVQSTVAVQATFRSTEASGWSLFDLQNINSQIWQFGINTGDDAFVVRDRTATAGANFPIKLNTGFSSGVGLEMDASGNWAMLGNLDMLSSQINNVSQLDNGGSGISFPSDTVTFDGSTIFNSRATFYSSTLHRDFVPALFGNSSDARLEWQQHTAGGNDFYFSAMVDSTYKNFVIKDTIDRLEAYNFGASTEPTLIIHDRSTTDANYAYMRYDGGTVIGAGVGDILLMNPVSINGNLAIGANYISNDGDNEGISIDTDGNVTLSGTLLLGGGLTMGGDLNMNTNSITNAVNITASGSISGGTLTDGGITITGGDINNVGTIFVNTLDDYDAGFITLAADIQNAGFDIIVPTNTADAFTIKDDAGPTVSFLTIDSTTATPIIDIWQNIDMHSKNISNVPQFDNGGSNIAIAAGDSLTFADNEGSIYGTGEDMDMGYDGTDGYIRTDLVAASDLNIDCGTDKTIELTEEVYDDIRNPVTAIRLAGAQPPTETSYRGGIVYAFPSNANKTLYFNVQLPHKYEEGQDIEFHIHYALPVAGAGGGAENVKWEVTYAWSNIDGAIPVETTTTQTIDVQSQSANTHYRGQIISAITGTSKNISSMLICSLTRDTTVANDYASSVYLMEVDFHVPMNTIGSRQPGTK
jgi:hypothetical protein